ncbi:MAG: amidohydrolase [Pirellulaceae bacterium]|nr:MAG: amidohydrolase [Pirellulaceae bacterium]
MDVAFADPQANRDRMERWIKEAAGAGAALVVFPECALCGYCFESLQEAWQWAEPIPGPSTEKIVELCRRIGIHVAFGMLERTESQLFNACALVGPDGVVGVYRKIHLPYLGVDRFATPGDRPFGVFRVGPARVGMHICYDGSFPESARVMALAGAEVVLLPTNWPPGAENTAKYLPNARALENHVYFAAVNRVGEERGFRFIGRSRIVDPTGETLAEAGDSEEKLLVAEANLEFARTKRIVRVPGKHIIDRFADRRPEMYRPIVESN